MFVQLLTETSVIFYCNTTEFLPKLNYLIDEHKYSLHEMLKSEYSAILIKLVTNMGPRVAPPHTGLLLLSSGLLPHFSATVSVREVKGYRCLCFCVSEIRKERPSV